ncbi:MAG: hypothetical protein CL886_07945 [Dehalococcoidia bacterium]|nr:hypothetical protein [Dehalococcoidia bacterium]
MKSIMNKNVMTIGNIEIMSISDGKLEFDICEFFPDIPDESWDQYRDHLTEENKVSFNLASYFLRSDGRNILVDTGMGPRSRHPDAPWGELMDDMKRNDISPSDIDLVIMTHAHRDHIGWNLTQENDRHVPTFPNARYCLSYKDWEACHNPDLIKERFPNAERCVWPLQELGLIDFLDDETSITSEIKAIATPGHTPGHVSIQISSGGETGIILGDVLHNTAQLREMDWSSRADIDPDLARQTRHSIVNIIEANDYKVLAGHLPSPGFGKIMKLNGVRYWHGF